VQPARWAHPAPRLHPRKPVGQIRTERGVCPAGHFSAMVAELETVLHPVPLARCHSLSAFRDPVARPVSAELRMLGPCEECRRHCCEEAGPDRPYSATVAICRHLSNVAHKRWVLRRVSMQVETQCRISPKPESS
jgi:hypothetical protein